VDIPTANTQTTTNTTDIRTRDTTEGTTKEIMAATRTRDSTEVTPTKEITVVSKETMAASREGTDQITLEMAVTITSMETITGLGALTMGLASKDRLLVLIMMRPLVMRTNLSKMSNNQIIMTIMGLMNIIITRVGRISSIKR
jgi:hypothetical protein